MKKTLFSLRVLDENLNEKNVRIKFLIGSPRLKIEMLPAGNQNDSLKSTRWWHVPARHQTNDTVVWVRTPTNTRYGGVGQPLLHQHSV
jgi:hypothetical protein